MSKFFIDRPIFAWVIALVIMLVGALSILKLPINQYPSIAPPAIAISVTYPGASAQTVQDTVVQVIEQQLNGIDNLRYVSSESNSDGSMTITATFEQGTNSDTAQVQVQNKLNLATPLLPQEVQQQGIRVTKAVKNFLLVIGVVSQDGSMSKDDLSNYPGRCQRRDLGAERSSVFRPTRWLAGAAWPATERHDHRQDPSADCRAVQGDPAEGQQGRFASAHR